MGQLAAIKVEPRKFRTLAAFEIRNFHGIVGQDRAYLVESEQQGAAPMRINLKWEYLPAGQTNILRFEIDRQRLASLRCGQNVSMLRL
jgi:hypothetical protein